MLIQYLAEHEKPSFEGDDDLAKFTLEDCFVYNQSSQFHRKIYEVATGLSFLW